MDRQHKPSSTINSASTTNQTQNTHTLLSLHSPRSQSSIQMGTQSTFKQQTIDYDNKSVASHILVSWAKYFHMRVREQSRPAAIYNYVANNHKYFRSSIVFVQNLEMGNSVLKLFEKNNNKGVFRFVYKANQLQTAINDLFDEKIKVIVLTAELSSKFLPHIPDYVDLVINESLPNQIGLLLRRVKRVFNKTKTTYSKGVVINMLLPSAHNKPEIFEHQSRVLQQFLKLNHVQSENIILSNLTKWSLNEHFGQVTIKNQAVKQQTKQSVPAKETKQLEQVGASDQPKRPSVSKPNQEQDQQKPKTEMNLVYNHNWATHIRFSTQQGYRKYASKQFISKNIDSFNKCIVYVASFNRCQQILNSLPSQIKVKAKSITTSLGTLNLLAEFEKDDSKILIVVNETAKKEINNWKVPQTVDLVIIQLMPATQEQFEGRVRKVVYEGKSSCFRGVVLNFLSNRGTNVVSKSQVDYINQFAQSKGINCIQSKIDYYTDYGLKEYFQTTINNQKNQEELPKQNDQRQQQQDSTVTHEQQQILDTGKTEQPNIKDKQDQIDSPPSFSFDWATYLLIQVQERYKGFTCAKYLKENTDKFKCCFIFVELQTRAKSIYNYIGDNEIKNQTSIVLNNKSIDQYFQRLTKGELRVLILLESAFTKNNVGNTWAVPNEVNLIINEAAPYSAEDLECWVRKSVDINQKIQYRGVVLNITTAVTKQTCSQVLGQFCKSKRIQINLEYGKTASKQGSSLGSFFVEVEIQRGKDRHLGNNINEAIQHNKKQQENPIEMNQGNNVQSSQGNVNQQNQMTRMYQKQQKQNDEKNEQYKLEEQKQRETGDNNSPQIYNQFKVQQNTKVKIMYEKEEDKEKRQDRNPTQTQTSAQAKENQQNLQSSRSNRAQSGNVLSGEQTKVKHVQKEQDVKGQDEGQVDEQRKSKRNESRANQQSLKQSSYINSPKDNDSYKQMNAQVEGQIHNRRSQHATQNNSQNQEFDTLADEFKVSEEYSASHAENAKPTQKIQQTHLQQIKQLIRQRDQKVASQIAKQKQTNIQKVMQKVSGIETLLRQMKKPVQLKEIDDCVDKSQGRINTSIINVAENLINKLKQHETVIIYKIQDQETKIVQKFVQQQNSLTTIIQKQKSTEEALNKKLQSIIQNNTSIDNKLQQVLQGSATKDNVNQIKDKIEQSNQIYTKQIGQTQTRIKDLISQSSKNTESQFDQLKQNQLQKSYQMKALIQAQGNRNQTITIKLNAIDYKFENQVKEQSQTLQQLSTELQKKYSELTQKKASIGIEDQKVNSKIKQHRQSISKAIKQKKSLMVENLQLKQRIKAEQDEKTKVSVQKNRVLEWKNQHEPAYTILVTQYDKKQKQLKQLHKKMHQKEESLKNTTQQLAKLREQAYQVKQSIRLYLASCAKAAKSQQTTTIKKSESKTVEDKVIDHIIQKNSVKDLVNKHLIPQITQTNQLKMILIELIKAVDESIKSVDYSSISEKQSFKKFQNKAKQNKIDDFYFYSSQIITLLVQQYDKIKYSNIQIDGSKVQLQQKIRRLSQGMQKSLKDGSQISADKSMSSNNFNENKSKNHFLRIFQIWNNLLQNYKGLRREKEQSQSKVKILQKQNEKSVGKINQLTGSINEKAKKISDLTKQNQALNERIKTLQSNLVLAGQQKTRLQQANSTISSQLRTKNQQNQTLGQQLKKNKQQSKKAIQQLNQENSRISQELTTKQRQNQAKVQQNKVIKQKLSKIQKDLRDSQTINQQLNTKYNNYFNNSQQIMGNQKQNIERLQRQLKDQKNQNQQIGKALNNQRNQKSKILLKITKFQQKINLFLKEDLNIDQMLNLDNVQNRITNCSQKYSIITSRNIFLVESELYASYNKDQRNFLFDSVKTIAGTRQISRTKTLFEGYQGCSWDQWLLKLTNKPNILVVLRLQNGYDIAGFSENPFSQELSTKGKGFLACITNQKLYNLKSSAAGKAARHDRFFFVLGNNELLVKGNFSFEVILSSLYSHFETTNVSSEQFIGQSKDEGMFKRVEFHQCFFE